MTDEELCLALREFDDLDRQAADRIEELERENKRLDAGWHEANAFTLKQGLRADALELALTQSRAETAAAYELAENHINSCSEGPWAKFGFQMAKEVRALATQEQSAALDAVKAEARAQGMREAADVAYEAWRKKATKEKICYQLGALAATQKGELK